MASVTRTLAHVTAEYPLYVPNVTPPPEKDFPQARLSVEELCSSQRLGAAIEASAKRYGVSVKHAAQVWWFSFVHSVANPSVTAMVEYDVVSDLDLRRGTLFQRISSTNNHILDDYWYGYLPPDEPWDRGQDGCGIAQADTALPGSDVLRTLMGAHSSLDPDEYSSDSLVAMAGSARDLAHSVAPVVDAVCEFAGLRPAPLWAVLGDGVIGHAAAAGNEAYEPGRGVVVGHALWAGLADRVPVPRWEVIHGGALQALHPHTDSAGDMKPNGASAQAARMGAIVGGIGADDHVVVRRSSCCMIYHSSTAEMCTSCPKQKAETRRQKLLEYVASL